MAWLNYKTLWWTKTLDFLSAQETTAADTNIASWTPENAIVNMRGNHGNHIGG